MLAKHYSICIMTVFTSDPYILLGAVIAIIGDKEVNSDKFEKRDPKQVF